MKMTVYNLENKLALTYAEFIDSKWMIIGAFLNKQLFILSHSLHI